jgi:hypothetical protein
MEVICAEKAVAENTKNKIGFKIIIIFLSFFKNDMHL